MPKKKTKDLKVYAVVIGDVKQNQQYITTCPFSNYGKAYDETPLAVYLKHSRACQARKLILADRGHKAVHIIKLEKVKAGKE